MMASPEGYRFRRPIVFPAMIVLRSKRRDGYIKTGKRFCSIARFHASPETFLLCPKVKADWRGVCNVFLKIKTFARADCPFLHLLSRSDLVQGQLQKCAQRAIFSMKSAAIGGMIERGESEPALLIAGKNIAITL